MLLPPLIHSIPPVVFPSPPSNDHVELLRVVYRLPQRLIHDKFALRKGASFPFCPPFPAIVVQRVFVSKGSTFHFPFEWKQCPFQAGMIDFLARVFDRRGTPRLPGWI